MARPEIEMSELSVEVSRVHQITNREYFRERVGLRKELGVEKEGVGRLQRSSHKEN